MAGKHNFRFDEDYVTSYYNKKVELKKLETEIKVMSEFIKNKMIEEQMYYTRVGAYTTFIEPCHKPKSEFMDIMRERGYQNLIIESCLMKDFKKVCDDQHLDENKYKELWYNKLYVRKGKVL